MARRSMWLTPRPTLRSSVGPGRAVAMAVRSRSCGWSRSASAARTPSLWAAAAASGADLLWRAKGNAVLPVLEHLPDGSFRFELIASTDKRRRQDVRTVRVIEYTGPPPPAPPTGW